MKKIINISTFFFISLLMGVSQPPLTSDMRKVGIVDINPQGYGRAPQFVPIQDFMFVELKTNEIPLVVETIISSNVIRASIWYNNSLPHTNFLTVSSNIISVTTNNVGVIK